ncbi:hypothetical protein NYO99_17125 [Pelomonas sp. UHG3]|jgi:hypothetical protein|uniref:Uncharacterized protein n=1 Tax=Roseateles hydrophilus TaxID=2975054 RepID=A0ACC6CEA6_9BURK|nr:hypothetical protein [Pelomonas sp. UHG3]MCY4746702.1 hypothetical protein [Pelomonas sp. UHG3]
MNDQSMHSSAGTNQLLHRSVAVELTLEQLDDIAGAQTTRYYMTGCDGCGGCDADYGRDND